MSLFKVPASSMSFLRGLVLTNKVNSPLASMAAARVIAQYAPLPPQPIAAPGNFFLNEAGVTMLSFVDSVLEIVPINHKAIQDYAKRFYQVRYDVAHGCCQPTITGSNGVYNLFHIGVYFSEEDLGLLKKSEDFAGLVAGFEAIYKACQENCASEG